MVDKYAPTGELERLQKARDDAKTPEEYQKACKDIDIYFFGEPKKGGGKKKKRKQKRQYRDNDDWEYNEWGDYE